MPPSSPESAAATGLPAFDGTLPPPRVVVIETTRHCNLKCPTCLQFLAGTTVSGPHMKIDLFRKVAAEVFPHVDVFQPTVSGEPFMSKGFVEMVETAKQWGVRLDITTNGTFLDERRRALVLPVLSALWLSIDGATRETFEKLRLGAKFDKVMGYMRALRDEVAELPREERPLIGFSPVLTRDNVHELPTMVELAHELRADRVVASHVHADENDTYSKEVCLVWSQDLATEWIGRAAARAEALCMPLFIGPLDAHVARAAGAENVDGNALPAWSIHQDRVPPPPVVRPTEAAAQTRGAEGSWVPPPAAEVVAAAAPATSVWGCRYLWERPHIALDGAVTPCCVPGAPVLGNLTEERFQDVWNGEEFVRMRVGLVKKDPTDFCRGCQHIVEVEDPGLIAGYLQGRGLPV
ncbi:MAG: hypothetical protein CMJ83_13510 [Planctomycetes bacterium]|nr:hypothetical protein [Planctomycetota bacterium]